MNTHAKDPLLWLRMNEWDCDPLAAARGDVDELYLQSLQYFLGRPATVSLDVAVHHSTAGLEALATLATQLLKTHKGVLELGGGHWNPKHKQWEGGRMWTSADVHVKGTVQIEPLS